MAELYKILSGIENVFNIKNINNESSIKKYYLIDICECSVKFSQNIFNIIIGIKKDFPISAPIIFWKDYKGKFFPHIEETDGKICYLEEGFYTFDYENLEGIISSCINMAASHIYNGQNKLNQDDFINEFDSYWIRVNGIIKAYSYINLNQNIKMVKVYILDNKLLIYENEKDCEYVLKQNSKKMELDKMRDAIYIPLENNVDIYPPKHNEMWTINVVRKIISKNLSKPKFKKLNRLLKRKKYINNIIISFPNKNQELVVIGIICYDFNKIARLHPIVTPFLNCKLDPIYIKRIDRNFLLNRGGAIDSLLEKKVLVLGCGSLGSYIIEQLVNIGINSITIVDKDIFLPENIYRHVLGYNNLNIQGSYKADEIQRYLKYKYRGLHVDALSYDLIDSIESEDIKLDEYDLIIVAIGNPNIEFYLNKKIHLFKKRIPTIYAWNEPYGIGGHVLVSNNTEKGCYECLYSDTNTGERILTNKASLVYNSEKYTNKYNGCGSAYIPYSCLDSIQTAILCSRVALEVLIGEERDNPLITWKGKNVYNIKTTNRYDLSEIELEKTKYLYKSAKCNICGKEQ